MAIAISAHYLNSEKSMTMLLILLTGLAVSGYAYKSGKRTGSRAGFYVGRRGRK